MIAQQLGAEEEEVLTFLLLEFLQEWPGGISIDQFPLAVQAFRQSHNLPASPPAAGLETGYEPSEEAAEQIVTLFLEEGSQDQQMALQRMREQITAPLSGVAFPDAALFQSYSSFFFCF